jgi:prepilin-type N-terminal cleavage/methylation domain-containing protein
MSIPVGRRRVGRRGFTIPEVIVAILVMVIGVLGLASTAGVVGRLMGSAAEQTTAANMAQSRFERMRSLQCNLLVNGSRTGNGLTERWRVDSMAPRVRLVTDSVIFLSGRRGTQVYRSYVQC